MYKWLVNIWQSAGKDRIALHFDLLLRRNFKVLLIQLTGLLLAFGGNVLLARLYGDQVYGVYSLLSNWVFILAVIALFGMDDSQLVRVPAMRLQSKKKVVLSHLKWSLEVNTTTILIVAIIFYILVNYFRIPGLSEHPLHFNVSLLTVCLLTVYNNLICFLRALDKVVLVEMADKILRPFVFLLLLLLLYYWWKTDLLMGAIMANAISLLCILAVSMLIIRKTVGSIGDNRQARDSGQAGKRGFPLAPNFRYVSLNLLYILSIRIDILILGLLSPSVEVGHYNVAMKFAEILAYPIAITNLSLPALLSKIRHDNGGVVRPAALSSIARSVVLQCLVLGALLLPLSVWILTWYGKGFSVSFPLVIVFFFSGLITASTGSIDIFFIMNGQERKVIYNRIVSVVMVPALAIVLIPVWGNMGAAVSSVAGNLAYCGFLQYSFYRKYGIFIHPFSRRVPSVAQKLF